MTAPLHILHDVADVDTLEQLGIHACAAHDARLPQLARDAGQVVIVDPRGRTQLEHLRQIAPHAELLEASLPPHVGSLTELLHRPGDVLDGPAKDAARTALAAFVDERGRILQHATDDPAPGSAFPLECLPPAVRAFVAGVAEAQGVDAALVASPALAALSGSIAATRRVGLKAGWLEPGHLWLATIAPSGSGKSPSAKAALEPVRQRDAELAARTKLDNEAHRAAVAAWRSNGGEGTEPAEPPQRQALLDDVTLEAAVARVCDNARGLLLAVDELCSFARSFDRYRTGGDLERWLAIFNGEPVRVDRKGSGSAFIERACIGVFGTIQPAVARELLGSKANTTNGFTSRFLLCAPPTAPALWRDTEVSQAARDGYRRVVGGLLDLELLDGQPVDLPLTKEARHDFKAWHDQMAHEATAAARANREMLAAFLSKLKGTTGRLALALQLAADAERGTAALTRSVGHEAMAGAIEVAAYFRDEMRALDEAWKAPLPAGDGSPVHVSKLRSILSDEWQSRRDLHRLLQGNATADQLGAALAHLLLTNEAERREHRGLGRPSEQWRRRPAS